MNLKKNYKGILLCLIIAIPCWFLGKKFPIVGGPVFGIILGMIITLFIKDKNELQSGITFTSKKILQYAVILLGFGMNLSVVLQTGKQSLPIILATISTSLIVAYLLHKIMHIPSKISTLIGVGSAINDTSSVTAAASTWDSMYHLQSATLDKAVTVKLTRTLAIIPITLVLSFFKLRKNKDGQKINLKKVFPFFIIYFVLASIITTVAIKMGVSADFFTPFKELSKFFIVLAMVAIGLNTNVIKLIKNGGKPIILGYICWICIACMSLFMQHLLGIW